MLLQSCPPIPTHHTLQAYSRWQWSNRWTLRIGAWGRGGRARAKNRRSGPKISTACLSVPSRLLWLSTALCWEPCSPPYLACHSVERALLQLLVLAETGRYALPTKSCSLPLIIGSRSCPGHLIAWNTYFVAAAKTSGPRRWCLRKGTWNRME